jgi:nucleoside-diphosphate kinase
MSCSVTDPRLAFHATYFDVASHTTKEFLCVFFHGDSTIELIDAKAGKTFLKRTPCPDLTKAHFFLGANIVVFGRVLTLVGYGDKVTEQLSERVSESVVAVVAADLFPRIGECLDIATIECGFGVCDMQATELRSADWDAPAGSSASAASLLPRSFAGKKVLVLHLIRDQALAKAQCLPERFERPSSVWVASSKQDVETASGLLALAHRRASATLGGGSSVVVVKPHIVSGKRGGEAVQALLDACPQLQLAALSQVTFSTARADEFMQPYKGVLAEYRSTVEHIASSACWVLQLIAKDGSDAVPVVREAVGPFDPAVAKVLRPKSLRARLGKDVSRNAFQVTDIPDDGEEDAAIIWGKR